VKRPLVVLLWYVALPSALYRPTWWPGEAHRYIAWDVLDSYWGDLAHLVESLREGTVPLWNPYALGGVSFTLDPHSSLLYPVQWLLALVGVALGGAPVGLIQAKVLLHVTLTGALLHAFLRRRGLPHVAALAGGTTAMMMLPVAYYRTSAIVWPLAWLGLVLIAIDRAVECPDGARAAQLGGAAALPALAGSPPGLWYVVLLAGAYALARLAQVRSWRGAAALAGGAATAGLIALPAYAQLLIEFRQSWRAGVDESGAGALALADLRRLAWPGTRLYAGAIPLALAVFGLARRRPATETVALGAVALLGAWLCTGREGHLLPWLVEHVPPFSSFRNAGRYRVLLIGLAVPAAFGLARLAERLPRAAWALALACAADVFVADRVLLGNLRPRLSTPETERTVLAALGEDARKFRVFDEFVLGQGAGPRLRLRDLRGYRNPLMDRRQAELLERAGREPSLLAAANVRWVLNLRHPISGTRSMAVPDPARGGAFARSPRDGRIYEAAAVAPHVAWYGQVERVLAALAAWVRLARARPGSAAFVEGPGARGLPAGGKVAPPVEGRVTEFSPNALEAVVDAPAAGLVVINEVYAPHWRASVDGRRVAIVRANALLRAVEVGPGRHTIRLRYVPVPFLATLPLAALALAVAAWLSWRARRA
jgi:hypothetical protein